MYFHLCGQAEYGYQVSGFETDHSPTCLCWVCGRFDTLGSPHPSQIHQRVCTLPARWVLENSQTARLHFERVALCFALLQAAQQQYRCTADNDPPPADPFVRQLLTELQEKYTRALCSLQQLEQCAAACPKPQDMV